MPRCVGDGETGTLGACWEALDVSTMSAYCLEAGSNLEVAIRTMPGESSPTLEEPIATCRRS